MKKRPIIIGLVVLILGSVIFWLQSNYIISGWLNGEAFYQRKPTSAWRRDLGDVIAQEFFSVSISGRTFSKGPREICFFRRSSSLEQWLNETLWHSSRSFVDELNSWESLTDHPLLTGDPEAKGVLSELMADESAAVREFAAKGLTRIQQRK
jgi:hypothetical protein